MVGEDVCVYFDAIILSLESLKIPCMLLDHFDIWFVLSHVL